MRYLLNTITEIVKELNYKQLKTIPNTDFGLIFETKK